jgi:ureidoglycolate lyase
MSPARILRAEPLTRAAFAPFGDVIQEDGAESYLINDGNTLRIHDLCNVDAGENGRALVSLFRALDTIALPYRPRLLECHPLGSQAFIPREVARFLIVVAAAGKTPNPGQLQAFVTDGVQGVNYAPGVWHLPLCSFSHATFAVVDRGGPGKNLREHKLDGDEIVITA